MHKQILNKALVLGLAIIALFGVELVNTGKAFAAVSARNGTSVLGGYVELGGTLRRNTSIMQGNNYKLGIGTRTPLNMLHLNSGTCNVAMRVQSTDPYALISFQDNLVSDVNALPYIGGTGDNIVFGLGADNLATIRSYTVTGGLQNLSKAQVKALNSRPTAPVMGELDVDYAFGMDFWADYIDANYGLWLWAEDGAVSYMNLDPRNSETAVVYNDLDTINGQPAAIDCSAQSAVTLGRMIYDTANDAVWVCTGGGTWQELAWVPVTGR